MIYSIIFERRTDGKEKTGKKTLPTTVTLETTKGKLNDLSDWRAGWNDSSDILNFNFEKEERGRFSRRDAGRRKRVRGEREREREH